MSGWRRRWTGTGAGRCSGSGSCKCSGRTRSTFRTATGGKGGRSDRVRHEGGEILAQAPAPRPVVGTTAPVGVALVFHRRNEVLCGGKARRRGFRAGPASHRRNETLTSYRARPTKGLGRSPRTGDRPKLTPPSFRFQEKSKSFGYSFGTEPTEEGDEGMSGSPVSLGGPWVVLRPPLARGPSYGRYGGTVGPTLPKGLPQLGLPVDPCVPCPPPVPPLLQDRR